MARQRRRRRRLLRAVGAAAALSLVAGIVFGARESGDGEDESPPAPLELPRGGRVLLPGNVIVALYGAPQAAELGALGIGTPGQAGARLIRQARPYGRDGRPVLPAFELIATIAAADAGSDGLYRFRQPHTVIRRYLEAARRRRALLILDIQPGRAEFMDEVRRLAPYLAEPDVGLALDPEWHVAEGEIPGQVIGSVDAETVNQVSAYLARVARRHDLPQKLLVVHQFTEDMIEGPELLEPRGRVAMVLNADGFGDKPNKRSKYAALRPPPGRPHLHSGFKLFYREDTDLMSPREVKALRPRPDFVVYE
jgi:hypothetical protein